jgi:hypothetical protein
MSLLSTFSTNGINILAGINGIEVGQSLIIACSVALNDLLYMPLPRIVLPGVGELWHHQGMSLLGVIGGEQMVQRHLLSLYFMLPLIGVCTGLLYHNWCVPLASAAPLSSSRLTFRIASQVPLARLHRRHVLLLCRHDLRLRCHHQPLSQDSPTLFPPSNLQLCAQLPAALRPGALPTPSPADVRRFSGPQKPLLALICGLPSLQARQGDAQAPSVQGDLPACPRPASGPAGRPLARTLRSSRPRPAKAQRGPRPGRPGRLAHPEHDQSDNPQVSGAAPRLLRDDAERILTPHAAPATPSFLLVHFGPLREEALTQLVMALQVRLPVPSEWMGLRPQSFRPS